MKVLIAPLVLRTPKKTRFYGGSESNDFRVACGVAQTNIGYTALEKHQRFLILSLVLSMKGMLRQWTRRFFITNNEKKKRNSREGVTSYLNKKLHKHSGGKSVKGSSMSLNSCSKLGSSKSSNSVTKCI